VANLPTPWGPITWSMRRSRNTDPIDVTIEGLKSLPPQGIVVRAPGCADEVVTALPARLSLSPR
ncbi:MAG TPA: hypothetical protein VF720_10835, partial [Candidatus Eisenbacteria bacterium]